MAAPAGKIEAFGRLYPKGTLMLAVHLDCYLCNWKREQGGLGAEGHFRAAWKIMWPEFAHNEWSDLIISAWCTYKFITIIGHQRASKTYTVAFCVYLDYLADPANTLTSISTVTFEGLRLRMWSDLLRAVETESIKDPFIVRSTTNECRIFPAEVQHQAGEKYQIHGMSISRTSDAEGRIRGGHANRRRIVLDEAQDMAKAIFDALPNPMSAPDAKAVFLSNPIERVSEFGAWCEPKDGWSSVNETDLHWETKKGGICLHLDGLQSPNIRAGRTLYPYMLTQQSIDEIVTAHGRDSVQFWALVRGWFPPDGMVAKVFNSGTIERGKASFVFDFQPQRCASLDPAFEHDNCVMHICQLGMPVFGERQYKISGEETMVFKFEAHQGSEPKDYQIAHWVMVECRQRNILPKHFIMDISGNARGVHAILVKEWSKDVQGVDYGGSATDRNLRGDDNRKCSEIYKFYVSELWCRAAECVKAGLIGGLEKLDPRTIEDLSVRRYSLVQGTKTKLIRVDPKDEVKTQLGRSPDFGDSFCQLGELLYRLGTIPGGGRWRAAEAGNKWAKQRSRVIAIGARHSPDKEFSY